MIENHTAVRIVPTPPRDPLNWDTVRRLEESGPHEIAAIARRRLLANEERERKRQRRWYRRLWGFLV